MPRQAQPKVVYVRAAPAKKRVYRKKPSSTAMVSMGKMSGRGDYTYSKPGPFGRYGRAIGSMIGAKYGGPLGQMLGGKLGSYAHYIGKIFGSGDYVTAPNQVKYNVLVNEGQVPQFGSDKNTVRIRHREFLGDVVSSSSANTFQIQSYAINPGLVASFPWLGLVCGATFQQYRINGMVFEFRSMSADALNSTNTALGSVVMATDYDSADAAFTTKSQMENTEFGVSCKPSSCMVHAIECAPRQTTATELYVRGQAAASGTDIRLYDWGKFYIATTGCQGTSVNLGELWVSYDITLFKSIQQPPGYLIPSAHYQLDPATLGTLPVKPLSGGTAFDTIGLSVPSSGLTVVFPVTIPLNSVWMIEISHVTNAGGAANATELGDVSLSNGFVAYQILKLNTNFTDKDPQPTPGTAVRHIGQRAFVKYTGGATPSALPTLTYVAPTVPLASYTHGDLVISMINGNLI